jgi:hypothetical protein
MSPVPDKLSDMEEPPTAYYREITGTIDPKEIEYEDYETVFDFVESRSAGKQVWKNVNEMSKFSWVGCGYGKFVLELLRYGAVKVERTKRGTVSWNSHFVACVCGLIFSFFDTFFNRDV